MAIIICKSKASKKKNPNIKPKINIFSYANNKFLLYFFGFMATYGLDIFLWDAPSNKSHINSYLNLILQNISELSSFIKKEKYMYMEKNKLSYWRQISFTLVA